MARTCGVSVLVETKQVRWLFQERQARGWHRAMPVEASLEDLTHRAEEALAADGVERTRLGYDVLVKLKMDDLLEQACVRMPASGDAAHPPVAVTARR